MIPDDSHAGAVSSEFARLLQLANDQLADAVDESTARTYEYLFREAWTPVCEVKGHSAHGAPPGAVLDLFEAAGVGEIRRFGNGNRRSGMVSPGHLDAILAAVRHVHVLAGIPSPLDAFTAEELADMRRGYRARYADQRVTCDPVPVLQVEDFAALCRTPGFVTREDGMLAIAGLLCLDAQATLDDLVALLDTDVRVAADGSHVAVALGSREVRIACHHEVAHSILPVCAACQIAYYASLPGPGSVDPVAFFGHRAGHGPGDPDLRDRLWRALVRAADSSPYLRIQRGRGLVQLQFTPESSPRMRTGARQLVAVAGTRQARVLLLAKTALKLVAGRGLTASDLFDRLTVGDCDHPPDELVESELVLHLPVTVRARRQDRAPVVVRAQDVSELCPVRALNEWLLVREATSGRASQPEDRLFVATVGWQKSSAKSITMGRARIQLLTLLETADLKDSGYTWESARLLHARTLVEAGAKETELYRTLRLKKPQHLDRMLSALPNGADNTARNVVAKSGETSDD